MCAVLPLQATNLLRGLRQIREAGTLGLLDGKQGIGAAAAEAAGVAVNATAKDYGLSRRVVTLSRFLLEHVHKWVRFGTLHACS